MEALRKRLRPVGKGETTNWSYRATFWKTREFPAAGLVNYKKNNNNNNNKRLKKIREILELM